MALVVAVGVVISACSTAPDQRVVVAAGTTVVDSGFIGAVVDIYRAEGGEAQISIVGLSTQQALAYASAGSADVTITHDRDALDAFLSARPGVSASPVFSSRFVLVGPPSLSFQDVTPSGILRAVASDPIPFVSRDDGSGTHAKELELWSIAGIDPSNASWYIRTGTGMGATLQVASARSAVTLAEVGVFFAAADQIDLVVISAEDASLDNPYDVAVVAGEDQPLAGAFVTWLLSDRGGRAIEDANEAIFGTQVYQVPSE
ncbi:MAG: substrate-binding domain-containing protein [Acidimicrobiia bacterium]